MQTLELSGEKESDIITAGKIIREGGLVVIPTETVYGLAANALDGNAVKGIYYAKGRPSDNPLIVHISDISEWDAVVKEIPEKARQLAENFWPGALTLVLPKADCIPLETSGRLNTVAVRCPSDPIAQAIIRAAGCPLAAPSANLSGSPSPTTFAHVKADMWGRVDAIMDGGDCQVGVESTVLSFLDEAPRLLRPGGVTVEAIQSVIGEIEVDSAVYDSLDLNDAGALKSAISPGMKYKHYAPNANITILDASPVVFADFVNRQFLSGEACFALCFEEDLKRLNKSLPYVTFGKQYDDKAQANRIFSALHELDEKGAKIVYARRPSKRQMGLAVFNRLLRASGFKIQRLEETYIIGLTGGSGVGKTLVGESFEKLGCYVLDCDSVTKSKGVYDAECIHKLQVAFGEDLAPDGILDRQLLATRAFSNTENTKLLNQIVHPYIMRELLNRIAYAENDGAHIIILDAPTLFEAGVDAWCDRIVAVQATRDVRISRIVLRDKLSVEAAELRIAAQQEDDFYNSKADVVIDNIEDADFLPQLYQFITDLRQK